MAQQEAGQRILEEQRLRIDRRIAEHVEQATSVATGPVPPDLSVDPERAQNTGAGCSNPGASSEVEQTAKGGAQDLAKSLKR